MEITTKVQKGGTITFSLPRNEMDRLGLKAGDTLLVETTETELNLILLYLDAENTSSASER